MSPRSRPPSSRASSAIRSPTRASRLSSPTGRRAARPSPDLLPWRREACRGRFRASTGGTLSRPVVPVVDKSLVSAVLGSFSAAGGDLPARGGLRLPGRFAQVAALTTLAVALAASAPSRAVDDSPAASAGAAADPAAVKDARQAELEAVARDIALSGARQAELKAEIAALDKDRATLNQTLIDTGKRVQALEDQIGATETRLASLGRDEQAIRASLAERRDVLAEVLAALQRMGRHPPPAILVRPEDALAAIHSAMLLGAVVPDLRAAAGKLSADLRQLVALTDEMERERDRLRADATALVEDRTRVQLLVEEKRKHADASAAALADEGRRAAELAAKAT